MFELADGASGPPEPLRGMPQVAHDEPVLPSALASSGPTEVRGGWRPIVDSSETERTFDRMTQYFLVFILVM